MLRISTQSMLSLPTVTKQRRVEWEGADLPVLLPPCTLYDAPDGQSAPPTITPQKAPCSGGKAPCSGASSRGSLTDRMVYTHPLGSLPGELEQKLNAIAPQQVWLYSARIKGRPELSSFSRVYTGGGGVNG